MLPPAIDSSIFGQLTLQESEFEIAGSAEHSCTFEADVSLATGKVRVVLNPDFDWPYPNDAGAQIRSLLKSAEQVHVRVQGLGTDGVFKLQRSGICELGENSGYDRWKASEEKLFANWSLESEIIFPNGFRLIYSRHPIYYLDLVLEFDSEFRPTHVQFDG